MSTLRVTIGIVTILITSMPSLGNVARVNRSLDGEITAERVSLKCRILGAPGDPAGAHWLVELRNAFSELLKRTVGIAGGTVRFKDLAPGIYRVCLVSDQHRSGCESVDLMPSPGKPSQEFSEDFRVPVSSIPGYGDQEVSIQELAVPEEAQAEYKDALQAKLNDRTKAELSHLKRAIEIYPEYVDAWNELGTFQYKAGNLQESIDSFRKVTELAPDFPAGWVNLSAILLACQRFEESIAAGEKALSLQPRDVFSHSQMGLSYYYLHDYSQAKKHLTRVLDLDPAFFTLPQLYLVPIALSEGLTGEATSYLQSFLKYHPNSSQASRARRILLQLADRIGRQDNPFH